MAVKTADMTMVVVVVVVVEEHFHVETRVWRRIIKRTDLCYSNVRNQKCVEICVGM